MLYLPHKETLVQYDFLSKLLLITTIYLIFLVPSIKVITTNANQKIFNFDAILTKRIIIRV